MTRSKTSKGLYPALLTSIAYLVFLVGSAPHRVHHFFDHPESGKHSVGWRTGWSDSEGSPHHHGYASSSGTHSDEQTGHETTPRNRCVVLAAFQQHPTSIVNPTFHTETEIAVYLEPQPALRPASTTRVNPYEERAPPFC